MNNNITIKPMKKSDFLQVVQLYITSLKDNKEGFIQDIDYNQSITEMMKFQNNRGGVYLLKENSKVIGMGALRNVDDESVELCKLHLHPSYKGRGLGKKMALELIEYAKELEYHKITLHVTKTQTPAIGLYGRLGFSVLKEKLCSVKNRGKILKFPTVYMEKELEEELVIA